MCADATDRIQSLIHQMTLQEKIGQLTMADRSNLSGGPELSEDQIEAVRAGQVGSILNVSDPETIRRAQQAATGESRLKIPLLVTLDVLHGYNTIFPIPLAEAAAFDPELWKATAGAAAEEAAGAHIALTFAPMLDVSRDIRWGRMAESPGEDPWLASRFAEAKVEGFQQDFSPASTLAATAKHLGAYGAVIGGREYNSVDISTRGLHEVHLPPFTAAVHSGVAAIMPSFNDLAAVPMTANAPILREIIRRRWGFDGVIVSDYAAVAELMVHGVAADLAEAAAQAIIAGVDIDMASDAYRTGLPLALERGLIVEAHIDEAVARVLALKEKLKLFAAPMRAGSGSVGSRRDLARSATRRSFVLMQNRGELLPLDRAAPQRLALIGPFAADQWNVLGPWCALGQPRETISFMSGIEAAFTGWTITSEPGCGFLERQPAKREAALQAAAEADLVLLCVGEPSEISGEGASRARPGLPDCQRDLAEAVCALGKPVIVVLCSGRPLTVPWLFDKAGTVLAAWYPGSEAGSALADILTGHHAPSGKLPVSWPFDVGQMPLFYAQRPTGRPADPSDRFTSRYVDMSEGPQFPFGHGLSYTRFSYGNLQLSKTEIGAGESLTVNVDITNDGEAEGTETAFLFIRDPLASVTRPVLELKGMARITLASGETGAVSIALSADDVAFPDPDGMMVLEPGEIEVLVGPSADRSGLLSRVMHVSSA